MKLGIREATKADLDDILAIGAASSTAPQWPRADFEAILAATADLPLRRMLLVAELEGAVVGFAVYTALLSIFPPDAELESLAVDPAWRRKGIGSALLTEIRDHLRAVGAETLLLEVRAGNVAGITLYASAGFKEAGIRKAYYAHPVEDAVCMQLRLLQPDLHASNE